MSIIYDSREKFEQFVAAQVCQLWAMFDDIQSRPPAPPIEPEPRRTFDEDAAEMTPEEVDRYLNDWSTNLPPDIFEALVARRSRRLRDAIADAKEEEELASIWLARKPHDPELSKRYHDACDALDAATRAYNNR